MATPGTAWVSGGASGIGAAIVAGLAERGHRVATLDLSAPQEAWGVRCDVADSASVAEATRRLVDEGGWPEVLVTSAGWSKTAPVAELALEDARRMLEVNYLGSMRMVQAVLPGMVARGGGRIVCIASGQAVRPTRGQAAYAASKAAVVALVKAAALEVADAGVTVNAVAPGMVDTPMTRELWGGEDEVRRAAEASAIANPMRRVIQPEDVAGAVLYLCTEAARSITGQVVHVNAGSLMP